MDGIFNTFSANIYVPIAPAKYRTIHIIRFVSWKSDESNASRIQAASPPPRATTSPFPAREMNTYRNMVLRNMPNGTVTVASAANSGVCVMPINSKEVRMVLGRLAIMPPSLVPIFSDTMVAMVIQMPETTTERINCCKNSADMDLLFQVMAKVGILVIYGYCFLKKAVGIFINHREMCILANSFKKTV